MDTGERLSDKKLNGTNPNYTFSDDGCPACEYEEQEKLSSNENNNELFRDIRKNHMRNKPCPCGSGRKFKACCWNKYSPKAVQARVKEAVAKRNELQSNESLTD